MPNKICITCLRELEASSQNFHKRKDSRDGLRNECRSCHSNRVSKWQKEHREYANAKMREWRDSNRDRYKETRKSWAFKNIESLRKTQKEQNRKRYLRNKEFITDYLSNHPYVDCGNSDIRVLEFDHIKGTKEFTVGSSNVTLERLEIEINKCEIRCANCHKIRHHEVRNALLCS